jgi:predicted transcriptional regulator
VQLSLAVLVTRPVMLEEVAMGRQHRHPHRHQYPHPHCSHPHNHPHDPTKHLLQLTRANRVQLSLAVLVTRPVMLEEVAMGRQH